MKICLTCRATKPLSAFYRNRSKSDGYHSSCRDCMNAYQRNSEQRNVRRGEKRKAIARRQQLFAVARPEPKSRRNWESDEDEAQPSSDEILLAPPPLYFSDGRRIDEPAFDERGRACQDWNDSHTIVDRPTPFTWLEMP